MDRLRNFLSILQNQLWPLPSVIMLAAGWLATYLLARGHELLPDPDSPPWWLYSGQASTARDLLASLLSGLMTMTSLVVSITFVILTLAANQLGPRLIAIFMGDRQIQAVLGLFIGTIVYMVLIMRTLDDTLGDEGVPHLAVSTATLLTLLCLVALLFYLHKIARLIIADNVVDTVSRGLQADFHKILPVEDEDRADEARDLHLSSPEGQAWNISLDVAGYVQVVDYNRLLTLACKKDIIIRADVRAGHHVLRCGNHVKVFAPVDPGRPVVNAIRRAFTIGTSRTPAQDPEQGIRQLVEIATRALSPGTNDPFTALAVIERLGSAIEVAFGRSDQQRVFRDAGGAVRLIVNRADIAGLIDAAFHPIRQAGGSHPAILIALSETILRLAPSVRLTAQCAALTEQIDRLAETMAAARFTESDHRDTRQRIDQARQALATIPAFQAHKAG
jgi:uncharacterized membrane protein